MRTLNATASGWNIMSGLFSDCLVKQIHQRISLEPVREREACKGSHMKFNLDINGKEREVEAEIDTPLLWVLRDGLHLTGTKFGCGVAQCGACTVHVDGETVRSCVMPVQEVEGRQIETIEGVSGPVVEAVQESWQGLQVPQCGYCQSGQIMTAVALLREIASPSDDDIDAAMTGNACRCATYYRIRKAIHDAASKIEG